MECDDPKTPLVQDIRAGWAKRAAFPLGSTTTKFHLFVVSCKACKKNLGAGARTAVVVTTRGPSHRASHGPSPVQR